MLCVNSEETEILVVGASQSGITAAIQAARMGRKVLLVSERQSIGGKLAEAGVSAMDGSELLAFQTGLWGEFLDRISRAEENLLSYGWVSLFTFSPRKAEKVFEEWLSEEPNITVLKNYKPNEVLFDSNNLSEKKVIGVKFIDENGKELSVKAKITIDATELGDLLAIGKLPHRLGWEYSGEFNEPSAPKTNFKIMQKYPVQRMTWVFFVKDYGKENKAPDIKKPAGYTYEKAQKLFSCAFSTGKNTNAKTKHGERIFPFESFISYGQVSKNQYMINWPKCGNDYGLEMQRLFDLNVKSQNGRERIHKEAFTRSLWFARYIQDSTHNRFGLDSESFPANKENFHTGGFAYIPYYRESRRIEGLETFTENDTTPKDGYSLACRKDSFVIGSYMNDHHYTYGTEKKIFKPAQRNLKWGGRYTGVPFCIPFGALVPANISGLLVAEEGASVSHLANGVSRLQPVCMLIGQAVGAIAAISVKENIEPFELSVSDAQAILLNSPKSPPSLVPLFDIRPDNPYRAAIQRLILSEIIELPKDGYFRPKDNINQETLNSWLTKAKLDSSEFFKIPVTREKAAYLIEKQARTLSKISVNENTGQPIANFPVRKYCAIAYKNDAGNFRLEKINGEDAKNKSASVITIDSEFNDFLNALKDKEKKETCFKGKFSADFGRILVTEITKN